MAGTVKSEWTKIKARFEQESKKKKPGEKLLGVFNKASGLTPAAEAFDKAFTSKDPDALEKAFEKLRTTANAYAQTLAKAAAAEKDANGKRLVEALEADMKDMVEDARKAALDECLFERPKTVAEFVTTMKKLGAPFTKYINQQHQVENTEFLLMMAARKHTEAVYRTYVAAGSSKEINIDGPLRDSFAQIAEAGNVAGAPWDQVTDEVLGLLRNDVFTAYRTRIINKFK